MTIRLTKVCVKNLRSSGMSLSESDKSSIADFNNFRKNNINNVKITKNGIPVDVKYIELSEMYPELFPPILQTLPTNSKNIRGIKKIATKEMDLDVFYGDRANDYREFTRTEFDNIIEEFTEELTNVGEKPAYVEYSQPQNADQNKPLLPVQQPFGTNTVGAAQNNPNSYDALQK